MLAAVVAGGVMAALFGVLVLTLRANQVASGLALTMFGLGLSALWGQGYSGLSAPAFPHLHVPGLTDLPLVGKLASLVIGSVTQKVLAQSKIPVLVYR